MNFEQLEEHMRQSLEGKFFPYIGKSEQYSETQQAAMKREALRRERARLEALKFERERPRFSGDITGKQIVAAVAYTHHVSIDDIKGRSRKKQVMLARHHLVWELRQRKTQYSTNKIAELLHRDHTTILNSLNFVSKNGHLLSDKLEAVAQLLNVRTT